MEASMIAETYETDTLAIKIPVKMESSGNPLNLADASIQVLAQRSGKPAVEASVVIVEPTNGVMIATFEPETFEVATYALQCRITKNGITQTVLNTQIRASKSLRAPA
jgi:hypothetical protein